MDSPKFRSQNLCLSKVMEEKPFLGSGGGGGGEGM